MGNKKILITIALLGIVPYAAACIRFSHSDNKTSEKQEPEGLTKLRAGLERAGKENDPFLREYILQEEAAKSKKTVNDYRLLFQSYRKNRTEFLPAYPKHQWSILAWGFWFFKEVSPNKQGELLKNSFLTIIEKGALITGALAVGKWLWESPQRRKQEQYQAWQIIHLADGKVVSGARKQALEDLNRQKASLAGLVAEKADLNKIFLKKANISGANLSDAELTEADLTKADLSFANLSSANISSANISGADLSFANISDADLRRANLSSANISSANISGANLSDADLTEVNLTEVNLSGANLSGANLSSANLSSAYLSLANISGANLSSANLSSANLSSANFSDANLSDADLTEVNLSDANLSGANLSDADLTEAYLSDADLTEAYLGSAKNLTPEQVKQAKNWEEAKYSEEFRKRLRLPPEPAKRSGEWL